MSDDDNTPYYFLNTLARAVSVLDQFIGSESELGVAEIARRVGIHKSVAYRILGTLADLGILAQGSTGGTYRLGVKSLELGLSYLRHSPLEHVSQVHLNQLASQLPDMAFHVAILDGTQIVYQKSVVGSEVKWMSPTLGRRHHAYCNSLGKVLLAYLSPTALESYLSSVELVPFTSNTITSPDALRNELGQVRSRGWAVDDQENYPNHFCVGAPIRDHTGYVIAAVSVAGLVEHFERYGLDSLVAMAKETAVKLSHDLGFSSSGRMINNL